MSNDSNQRLGAEELVRRAIEMMRIPWQTDGRKRRGKPSPLGERIGVIFGFLGKPALTEICERFGFDPKEIYKR